MSSANCDGDKDAEFGRALLESVWKRIQSHLEAERHRIYEEIKDYPRPIPACDLQFNQLLEKRTRIGHDLERLHEAIQVGLGDGNILEVLDDFLCSTSSIDIVLKEQLKTALEEGRSGLAAKWTGYGIPRHR